MPRWEWTQGAAGRAYVKSAMLGASALCAAAAAAEQRRRATADLVNLRSYRSLALLKYSTRCIVEHPYLQFSRGVYSRFFFEKRYGDVIIISIDLLQREGARRPPPSPFPSRKVNRLIDFYDLISMLKVPIV